jgi:hypothetical protein
MQVWQIVWALLPYTVAVDSPSVVLFVLADDFGWYNVGFRNKEMRTPAIDSLKREGILLTRHYSFKVFSFGFGSFFAVLTCVGCVSSVAPPDLRFYLVASHTTLIKASLRVSTPLVALTSE